jgi:hypothetical protein
MRIRLLEIAQIELDQAIEYYNYESPGLGNAFLTEVLKVLDRIGEFPEAWHPLSARTRRCQTPIKLYVFPCNYHGFYHFRMSPMTLAWR